MYSIEGSELFIYLGGQKVGPFDLAGLLALVDSGSSSRRRLLDANGRRGRRLPEDGSSSGLSISSLDYDGSSLWVVLSNGWVQAWHG